MRKIASFLASAGAAFLFYLLLSATLRWQDLVLAITTALLGALFLLPCLPNRRRVPTPAGFYLSTRQYARQYAQKFARWARLSVLAGQSLRNLPVLASMLFSLKLSITFCLFSKKTAITSPAGKLLLLAGVTMLPGLLLVDLRGQMITVHCMAGKKGSEDSDSLKRWEQTLRETLE